MSIKQSSCAGRGTKFIMSPQRQAPLHWSMTHEEDTDSGNDSVITRH